MPAHDKMGPDHYKLGNSLQAINLIDIIIGQCPTSREAYRLGNVIKYLSRYRAKNGLADLYKARHYLEWLIEELEDEERTQSEEKD